MRFRKICPESLCFSDTTHLRSSARRRLCSRFLPGCLLQPACAGPAGRRPSTGPDRSRSAGLFWKGRQDSWLFDAPSDREWRADRSRRGRRPGIRFDLPIPEDRCGTWVSRDVYLRDRLFYNGSESFWPERIGGPAVRRNRPREEALRRAAVGEIKLYTARRFIVCIIDSRRLGASPGMRSFFEFAG